MVSFWKNNRAVRRLLLGVAVLAAAVWAAQLWWHWMYPVAQFRYKLTVEVMTPDGLKSGSSVIEVRYSSSHPLPNPGRYYNDALVAGEAVYVDLGQGKNLFVLLSTIRSGRSNVDDWGGLRTGPEITESLHMMVRRRRLICHEWFLGLIECQEMKPRLPGR